MTLKIALQAPAPRAIASTDNDAEARIYTEHPPTVTNILPHDSNIVSRPRLSR